VNSYEDLKTRKAWDFAISPVKSLPMQAFMLYMSGGGVQIFSMGIVAMLLLSPFKNLSCMNEGALMFCFVSFRCTAGGVLVRCLVTVPPVLLVLPAHPPPIRRFLPLFCFADRIYPAFAPFAPGPASSSPTAKSKSPFTLPLQKLAYIICNILTLALGLWKCRSMGLLPTGTGDWLAFESRGSAPEISLF
jgi:ER membrane protein complex subunit 4